MQGTHQFQPNATIVGISTKCDSVVAHPNADAVVRNGDSAQLESKGLRQAHHYGTPDTISLVYLM